NRSNCPVGAGECREMWNQIRMSLLALCATRLLQGLGYTAAPRIRRAADSFAVCGRISKLARQLNPPARADILWPGCQFPSLRSCSGRMEAAGRTRIERRPGPGVGPGCGVSEAVWKVRRRRLLSTLHWQERVFGSVAIP